MTALDETVLAGLVAARAEEKPDLDVLTFERAVSTEGRFGDEVRTYAELWRNANRIAAALVEHGLARGDRFGLMMRNHPEFVETLVAASITGCIAVPIDSRTRGDKLAFTLNDAGCATVVCGGYVLPQIDEIRGRVPCLASLLVVEDDDEPSPIALESVRGAEPLAAALARDVGTVDCRLRSPSDPLQIIYTSGTTGDPKGVVFPNDRFGLFAMLGAVFGYEPDERPYTGLSLTHGNAQAVTLGPSLHSGMRAVFSRRFTKSRLWRICRRHGCTSFSLLGGMATAIYAEPAREDDDDNPVRVVISAGMPAAIWAAFEKRFGVRIFEWYGAVEGGLAFKPVDVGPIGSFGKPAPGLDMRVVDENGDECPPGVVGEIVSRPAGGSAQVEYFRNEAASKAKTAGGWLRSGDMGHRDADGWFYFDYRKGGGIRHNGDFVHTGYVEKAIAEHPAVADVFVYGVPAASGAPGEKDVVAAVVADRGAELRAASVFAWCRARLEPNFVPSYLQVVDEIPKTASEKPQERFLVAAFAADAPNVFAASGSSSAPAPDPAGPHLR